MKHTTFKQTKVRYSDTGKGRTIILLHGFLESLDVFNAVVKPLSKRYRVVCIDLPGHGETPCIGYVHSMELMAKCVKAVADSLLLRKYIIIGHSMGGYAALAFAELFPQQVKALGLWHSTSLPDSAEKKKDRDAAIKAVKRNQKTYIHKTVKRLFAPGNMKKFKKEAEQVTRIAENTSRQSIVACLEGMKDRAGRETILKFARFPVLILAGKKDLIIPYESLEKQAEQFPTSKLVTLEYSGHVGFYEEPERCADEIKKFAGKVYR